MYIDKICVKKGTEVNILFSLQQQHRQPKRSSPAYLGNVFFVVAVVFLPV